MPAVQAMTVLHFQSFPKPAWPTPAGRCSGPGGSFRRVGQFVVGRNPLEPRLQAVLISKLLPKRRGHARNWCLFSKDGMCPAADAGRTASSPRRWEVLSTYRHWSPRIARKSDSPVCSEGSVLSAMIGAGPVAVPKARPSIILDVLRTGFDFHPLQCMGQRPRAVNGRSLLLQWYPWLTALESCQADGDGSEKDSVAGMRAAVQSRPSCQRRTLHYTATVRIPKSQSPTGARLRCTNLCLAGTGTHFRILDHVVGYCSRQCRVGICTVRSPSGCFGCNHPVTPVESDSSCWEHGGACHGPFHPKSTRRPIRVGEPVQHGRWLQSARPCFRIPYPP